MLPATASLAPQEAALQGFLARLSPETALRVRTLAHAWAAAGGSLAVGRLSIRLVAAHDPAP
ncbi:MAG TPA: hypothetical protein VHI93_09075, partial [Candidatus Thermoplasmatota archaeon]|nr:hypothetical protein [Candidatus Thermoplasmatota archaeon]